ncbi:MAG: LPS-assembly protein LptD [Cyclobacteriaceae bacterium]|nr:LPS-assembly protein LptD [Cyclobacteriaceae bacterium]
MVPIAIGTTGLYATSPYKLLWLIKSGLVGSFRFNPLPAAHAYCAYRPSLRLLFSLTLFVTLVSVLSTQAQQQPRPESPIGSQPPPSIKADTSSIKKDSVKTAKKGDIETTIVYSATDSINFSLDRKIVKLYGDAKVKYGSIQLDAELIVIDYEKSTISANGRPDSLGHLLNFPVFKDGNEEYETKSMTYDFKLKKAYITEVVTKQGEGFMAGSRVYKNDKNELFTINNTYTTCDLKDPHFRIISKKAKAIPGDKIVTGPFYMEFNHVPTPLGFAFGMFPSQRQSSSGIIIPEYGEEQRRGFFLRNAGYFFDISDYVKLTLTADIYSKGSNAVKINTVYNNRYKYSGSLNFAFTSNLVNDKFEDQSRLKDFQLSWSHSPKSRGSSRFSASVNAASSSFTANNYLGVNVNPNLQRPDNVSRKLTSNISYSKTFPGTPFTLGVNMRHSQDLSTGQVDLPLPDVTFNVNNLYPFKNKGLGEAFENFNMRYSMTGTNQITNNIGRIGNSTKDSIASFSGENFGLFFRNAKNGIKHNIPLSTTIKVKKYFAVSPNISIDETWYFQKLNWGVDATGTKAVIKDTSRVFNRITNYSFAVSLTTRIYGTYLAKNPDSKIRGLRHVITPNISYSYTPDFSNPSYDYFQQLNIKDASGKTISVLKSRHEGFVYGGSRSGLSNAVSFGIGNTIEMKVKGKKDTVERKVSIFNNLSVNSSYNFAADSFKLAPISMSANTNVLNNKININLNATLDPYVIEKGWNTLSIPTEGVSVVERRRDKFVWANGSFGRITSAGLAFSTNLSPKGQKSDNEMRDKVAKSNANQADKDYLLQNPNTYVDFNIPWNLRINYNISYSHNVNQASQITQALNFSGDLSLTQKWKMTFNSGYDFVSGQITQTNFGINRDIHCWQLSLNWVPFGPFQNYTFNIGVKSTLLRDLKLNRTRSFFDVRQ